MPRPFKLRAKYDPRKRLVKPSKKRLSRDYLLRWAERAEEGFDDAGNPTPLLFQLAEECNNFKVLKKQALFLLNKIETVSYPKRYNAFLRRVISDLKEVYREQLDYEKAVGGRSFWYGE